MCLRLLVPLALMAGAADVPARAELLAPVLSLDHVSIQAVDLDRSTTFYVGILGLAELPAPFPHTAVRWIALGEGQALHIVGHGTTKTERNRWDHIALACTDLDGLIARLDQRHMAWGRMDGKHEIQTRPDGIRQIFIRDPDGYLIELNNAGKPR